MPTNAITVIESYGFLYWLLANGRQVAIYNNLAYWRSQIGRTLVPEFQALEPSDDEFIQMLGRKER